MTLYSDLILKIYRGNLTKITIFSERKVAFINMSYFVSVMTLVEFGATWQRWSAQGPPSPYLVATPISTSFGAGETQEAVEGPKCIL